MLRITPFVVGNTNTDKVEIVDRTLDEARKVEEAAFVVERLFDEDKLRDDVLIPGDEDSKKVELLDMPLVSSFEIDEIVPANKIKTHIYI